MAKDFDREIDPNIRLKLLVPEDAPELFAVTDADRAHLRV